MLDAQRQTYGDGLDDAALHPYHVGGQGPLLQHRHLLLQLPLRLANSSGSASSLGARPTRSASSPPSTSC